MTSGRIIRVFDPSGHVHRVSVEAAARPASLDGLRIGILSNRKMNAQLLLESMVDALGERVKLTGRTLATKPSNGPPSRQVRDTLVENSDFALVGTAD